LAWRDILVRYKTTIGITWALARPLLIMLVFTLVFSAMLCGVRGTQSARSLRHLEMAGRTRLAAHSQETGLEVVIVPPAAGLWSRFEREFHQPAGRNRSRNSIAAGGREQCAQSGVCGHLADALIACATHPAAAGQTYLVGDGDDVLTAMLVEKIARALGRNSRAFYFPPALLGAMAAASGRAEQVDRLFGSLRVNDEKMRRELAWLLPYKLEQGLRATAEWYRSRHPR
jgi:nucleoside-diphosphate-sugar epimerase